MNDFYNLADDDADEPAEKGKITIAPAPIKRLTKRPLPFSASKSLVRIGYDWREWVLEQDINELEYLLLIGEVDTLSPLIDLANEDNVQTNVEHDYSFVKVQKHHLQHQMDKPPKIENLKYTARDERLMLTHMPRKLTSKKTKKDLTKIVDAAHAFGVQFHQDLALDGFPLYLMNELDICNYTDDPERVNAEIKKRVSPHYIIVGSDNPEKASKLTTITDELKTICEKKRKDRTFNHRGIRSTRVVPQGFPPELEGYFVNTFTDRPPHRTRADLRAEKPDAFYLQEIVSSLNKMVSNQNKQYSALTKLLKRKE